MKRWRQLLPILMLSIWTVTCAAQTVQPPHTAMSDGAPLPGISIIGDQSSRLPPPFGKSMAQWSTLANIPESKWAHCGAYVNGTLYIFGGFNSQNAFTLTSFKYNIASNTWSAIKNLPANRAFGHAEAINNKIYLFGGYNSSTITMETPVLEYDPAADTYTTVSTWSSAVAGAATAVVGGKIYVIGGTGGATGSFSGDYKNSVQIFDPTTKQWSAGTAYPLAVRTVAAAAVGNTIIVTCGYNGQFTAATYRGEVSGSTITWQAAPNYPAGGTSRLSGGSSSGKIYFTGGGQQSTNCLPNTYAFNLATNTWESQDNKPTGIQNSTRLMFDGSDKLYVVGGTMLSGTSTLPSAVTEAFSSQTSSVPQFTMNTTSVPVALKRGTTTSRTITFSNAGGAPLTWSAAVNPASGWVTLQPSSGTVPPGLGGSLQLSFSTNGAPDGNSSATLQFTTNDPANPSVSVSLNLYVQAQEVDTEPIVLLEEGTGTWCGYCPYGADSVHAVVQRNGGKVVAISYHGGSALTATTEPMYTPTTTTWATNISLQGWPQGSINRIKFADQKIIALDRDKWASRAEQVLSARRSPVSINVTAKQYNPNTKQGSLTIETFFHQPLSGGIRLNVAQVEDGLNWAQIFYPPGGSTTTLKPYYHENVLRQMLPNDYGEIINTGGNVASQTAVTKTIAFTSRDSLPGNSRFIIFVHYSNGTTFGEVLQAKQMSLNSLTDVSSEPVPAFYSLSQNFPNPLSVGGGSFSTLTTIRYALPRFEQVMLTVTDMLGRTVQTLASGWMDAGVHDVVFDARNLPSGIYLYTLTAGSFKQTRKMILTK